MGKDERCARGCCASQAEHYKSVVVRPLPSPASQREKALTTDLAAYRRLRDSGVTPKSHVGAAALERDARAPVEVEQGHIIRNDRLRRQVQQAHDNVPPPSVA